jgi:hypothetical protein
LDPADKPHQGREHSGKPPTRRSAMAATQHDLVGRDVYARDGDKIGQITELV